MNKELAKTLTTALVQFIDRERPEGTMCCSNTDCANLENAFNGENFNYIEAYIKWKLLRLTEFESAFVRFLSMSQGEPPKGIEDFAKEHSKELLDLAKKELLKDDELSKKHLEGYIKGREDTMREMKDFIESHFNINKAKRDVDLTDLYHKEYGMNPEPFPRGIAYKSPKCYTDVSISSDTQSGISTLKAEG